MKFFVLFLNQLKRFDAAILIGISLDRWKFMSRKKMCKSKTELTKRKKESAKKKKCKSKKHIQNQIRKLLNTHLSNRFYSNTI